MKAKIRILIRKIKRSFKKNREQWIKGGILAVILLVIVIFAGSCACSKKTVKAPDAASQGVMKITPIPSPTPTPEPRQVSKDAVAQSGSVTMVNEYLVQKAVGKTFGNAKTDIAPAAQDNTSDDTSDSADSAEDTSESDNSDSSEE